MFMRLSIALPVFRLGTAPTNGRAMLSMLSLPSLPRMQRAIEHLCDELAIEPEPYQPGLF